MAERKKRKNAGKKKTGKNMTKKGMSKPKKGNNNNSGCSTCG